MGPGNFANWGYGFCNWGPGLGLGHGFMGWLFPLLFWGLFIYCFIRLLRHFIPHGKTSGTDTALEMLRARYASGEINQEEFTEMKLTLASK